MMEVKRTDWTALVENVQRLNLMQPMAVQEIERLQTCLGEMRKKIERIDKEVSGDLRVLNFKISIWGAIGGAIPVLITIAIALLIYFIRSRGP